MSVYVYCISIVNNRKKTNWGRLWVFVLFCLHRMKRNGMEWYWIVVLLIGNDRMNGFVWCCQLICAHFHMAAWLVYKWFIDSILLYGSNGKCSKNIQWKCQWHIFNYLTKWTKGILKRELQNRSATLDLYTGHALEKKCFIDFLEGKKLIVLSFTCMCLWGTMKCKIQRNHRLYMIATTGKWCKK